MLASRRSWWRLVVVGALALSSCGVQDLAFVRDERIDIVRPDDRATVSLPLRLEWEVRDNALPAGDDRFGIFVDRAPPRSGATVESLFDEDCPHEPGTHACRVEFLEQRNIYATTSTTLTVRRVPRLTGAQRRRLHEITVVLLDADGRRVGEGAWSVQFRLEDRS